MIQKIGIAAVLTICAIFSLSFLPSAFALINVTYVAQSDPNWCGPAALTMVLNYWGANVTQAQVASQVYNNQTHLTYIDSMVSYPQRLGFTATAFTGTLDSLKQYIDEGFPLIVLQRFSDSDTYGHFRVVIGYDNSKNWTVTDDPDMYPNYNISYSDFVQLWQPGSTFSTVNWTLAIEPVYKIVEPTPSPSPTATPTPSPSPTPTPTPTATPTPSPTATPTATPSPTPTATPKPTPKPTPIFLTPTPEPTETPTAEPTPTATPEPTATPVPTPSDTPVMTPSPTPVSTATPSPTPTPTATPAPATPTPSVSIAPSATPTATASPTQSPTPIETSTPMQSAIPTVTAPVPYKIEGYVNWTVVFGVLAIDIIVVVLLAVILVRKQRL